MKLKTIATILALSSSALFAQTVEVQGAWARATVPGQKATGAFMKLTAKDGTKLVSVSTPAAGVSEVHEMKMDGNVMRMRELEAENSRLKRMYADLALENPAIKDVLSRKL